MGDTADTYRCEAHEKRLDDIDERMRKLEKAHWFFLGAVTLFAALASFAGATLGG